jgi:hypothetical protein
MSARLASFDQKRNELTPGTVLVREWDRQSQRVMVLADGLVTPLTFPGSGRTYASGRELTPFAGKDAYTERELEIYTQCPARYRNEYIDGLRGGRDESAYLRFHRCVYKTVGWLEAERMQVAFDGSNPRRHPVRPRLTVLLAE